MQFLIYFILFGVFGTAVGVLIFFWGSSENRDSKTAPIRDFSHCPYGSDGSDAVVDNGILYIIPCDEFWHCDKTCYIESLEE